MQSERASKRQQELLSFVDGFIKGNGYGPSYREIMRALDYKSVSTVATHVDNLIAKGYLARRDKSARSLEVVSLRPVSPVSSEPVPGRPSVEQDVITIVQNAELSVDQLQQVAATFELLNMTKVHDAVQQTIKAKTAS